MRTSKLHYLYGIAVAIFCFSSLAFQVQAKTIKENSAADSGKDRLVLMPLRVPPEDKNLTGAMETALVEGLQQKYIVFSGEQVSQKAREIFLKETRNTAHKECDETKCMQNIAMAFQAELLATANVTKQDGIYYLALSVQNIFDNKVEYSKSLTCESCNGAKVVDKLKELSGVMVPKAATSVAVKEKPELVASTSGNNAGLNINCTGDDIGAEIWINDKLRGECPVELKVPEGKVKLKLIKVVDADHDRFFEQIVNVFADSTKRMDVKLEFLLSAEGNRKEALVSQKIEENMVAIPNKNYALGKYDVTRGEFAKFVAETGYDTGNLCYLTTNGLFIKNPNGKNWRNPGFVQDDTHPVTCVNGNDAQAYATWLSKKTGKQYRLPNEEEWEYACYGGSKTEYCGGGDLNSIAWYNDNSNSATHPVGQKQANGYGLFDMSGNVFQLMENKYDSEHDRLAVRGGSWYSSSDYLRSTYRSWCDPAFRKKDFGFRLARTLP